MKIVTNTHSTALANKTYMSVCLPSTCMYIRFFLLRQRSSFVAVFIHSTSEKRQIDVHFCLIAFFLSMAYFFPYSFAIGQQLSFENQFSTI